MKAISNIPYSEIKKELARRRLISFVEYMKEDYKTQWFHRDIAIQLQRLYAGEIKRLMLFVPPQNGKSTLASRYFPAWVFGKNPNTRIIHAAYGYDLVQGFSRDIQRIIDTPEYYSIFENTTLNDNHVRANSSKGYKRTVEEFEIVNSTGSYYCSSVGGGITGKSCDIAIIDDPIKGAADANSKTIRDNIWNWYNGDLLTRIRNESKIIIIMTRWHVDDLAGRLLEKEPNKWTVVSYPAIKENNDNNNDIRNIGEPLWPNEHSLEMLLDKQKSNPSMFAALYQQNPVIQGGNIVKSEWFKYCDFEEFKKIKGDRPIDFWLDTAYTDKTKADPSGIIATCLVNGKMYIINAKKVHYEFPELIEFIKLWVKENGYTSGSRIFIEPKANGLSVIQHLKKQTGLNVLKGKEPKGDKTTRLEVAAPSIQADKVVLIKDIWNDSFISEICSFPSVAHDEYVDVIGYAIDYYYNKQTPAIIW